MFFEIVTSGQIFAGPLLNHDATIAVVSHNSTQYGISTPLSSIDAVLASHPSTYNVYTTRSTAFEPIIDIANILSRFCDAYDYFIETTVTEVSLPVFIWLFGFLMMGFLGLQKLKIGI